MSGGATSFREAGVTVHRPLLSFCFFNAVNWQVALGTPMVLLAEALGATPFQVGLAWSFVLLMVPIQVAATPLLGILGFRRTMLAGWGSRALMLLPPIYIAWVAREGTVLPWMVPVLIGSVFLYTLLRAVGSGAWMPWIIAIVPETVRGRYFAMEQILGGLSSVGILLLSAILFKVLSVWDAFLVQYILAFTSAVISWIAIRRIPDAEKPKIIGLGHVARVTPGILFGSGTFQRFLMLCCLYAAISSGVVPFCAYFLKNQLAVGGDSILMYETLRNVGLILGSLLLRNEIDRLGPRPFFLTSMVLLGLVAVFWIAALVFSFSPSMYLPLVNLLIGMSGAAWVAASLSFLPGVTPDSERAVALAIHGAATSFSGGAATTLWGFILREEVGGRPSMDLGGFLAFFVVLFAGLVFLAVRLVKLPYKNQPRGERLLSGAALLRPSRAFTYFVTLVDQSFTRGRK